MIRSSLPWLTLVLIGALLGLLAVVGSDLLWAATMGREILAARGIPVGVPFAELPTDSWVNVPVLGQVILAKAAEAPSGLVVLHLLLVLGALAIVIHQARLGGADPWAVAVVLGLVAIASLSSLVIIRMPGLSLLPWVIVMGLTRECMRSGVTPPRAVSMLITITIWGNLHGGVLVGLLLLLSAGAFALMVPPRRRHIAALGALAAACVFIVTPAGLETWRYYLGALSNEAARQGTHLWAAPDLRNPLDVLMVAALAALCLAFARARPPMWEVIAVIGMVIATFSSARHGVWVALFLASRASIGLQRQQEGRIGQTLLPALLTTCMATILGTLALSQRESPVVLWSNAVPRISFVAGDRPILAPEPIAETLAFQGAHVVMGNPLDAFAAEDQRAYLEFVDGVALAERLLVPRVIIAAPSGSRAADLADGDRRLEPMAPVDGVSLWRVSPRLSDQ